MVKPPCPTRIIDLLNEWMHVKGCGAYADSDEIYEGEGYVIQHRGVGSVSTSSSCPKKEIFSFCTKAIEANHASCRSNRRLDFK
jgi:hypothetical protein